MAAAGERVHGVGPEAVSPALGRAGRRLTTRYVEVGRALARPVHTLSLGGGRGAAKIHCGKCRPRELGFLRS